MVLFVSDSGLCLRVVHQTHILWEIRQLVRASSSSHWMDTKDTLNKLIKLTVETGMITAFGATIELILFWAFHQNNVHFIL